MPERGAYGMVSRGASDTKERWRKSGGCVMHGRMSGMLFGTVDVDDRIGENVWRVGGMLTMDTGSIEVTEYVPVRRGLDPRKEDESPEKALPKSDVIVIPNHGRSRRPSD